MKKLPLLILLFPMFLLAQPKEGMEHAEWVARQAQKNQNLFPDGIVTIKSKTLLKFGSNGDIDTDIEEMVWEVGGIEKYQANNVNGIDSIVSRSNSETSLVTIEGHTCNGDTVTFVTQDITLTGNTPVALTTPLWRCSRMFNNNGTDLLDTVFVYSGGTVTSGVPQSRDSIYVLAYDENQSFKAATTISSYDWWFITEAVFTVEKSGGTLRYVDFHLEVREYGKTFRPKFKANVSNQNGSLFVTFDPPILVPPGSDVRVNATSSGTDTEVDANLNGYLAYIVR